MSQQAILCSLPFETIEDGFDFRMGVLVPPKIIPKKKVAFVGDIKSESP